MDSPDRLMEEARKGSVDAFCGILELFQGRIRAFIRRYVFDRSTSDDLAQETFLAAYRSLNQYEIDTRVDLWLLRIARNCTLKYLRGEARRKSHETRRFQVAVTGWCADRLDAADFVREREISALGACLKRLPGDSARLVESYYSERLTSVEIARRLGKKESTVRVALLRIRQALRECIETRLTSLEAQS